MFLKSTDIATAIALANKFIGNIVYNRFLKTLYGLEFTETKADDALMLVLHALENYDTRRGAVNVITAKQAQSLIECINRMKGIDLATEQLSVDKYKCVPPLRPTDPYIPQPDCCGLIVNNCYITVNGTNLNT